MRSGCEESCILRNNRVSDVCPAPKRRRELMDVGETSLGAVKRYVICMIEYLVELQILRCSDLARDFSTYHHEQCCNTAMLLMVFWKHDCGALVKGKYFFIMCFCLSLFSQTG